MRNATRGGNKEEPHSGHGLWSVSVNTLKVESRGVDRNNVLMI